MLSDYYFITLFRFIVPFVLSHFNRLYKTLIFFPFAASPLPQIKYNKVEWKSKTPARRFYNHPLVLSRLKNFVKVPGYTGLCVDTENAAVWASASSAFSVSFLAKFCTPWYLRSSELRQIQRMIHKTPCPEFIYFKFPLTGNPLSLSFLSEIR